jgi:tetratricopeptide (TPR) repeat protein
VYTLPPPDEVVAASLGYRSALADLIYAHVLVSYGLHFQEKRRFEFVGEYLDTINALDPTFRDPYRYADTLLVMSPETPSLKEYVKAKEILERGLRNRPYDTDLWLQAGQYMAYLARPYLEDPEMKKAWQKRGAEVLARACELASDNENVPYHCIVAARLFDVVGEREAAIASLRRILAVNDDPEIEQIALSYLQKNLHDRDVLHRRNRKEALERLRQRELPFVSKDAFLLLGPPFDPAVCAGLSHFEDSGCETSWSVWAEHAERDARRGDAS